MTDLLFAARTLRKDAGFTAVAVATLALAIGANTAIFSIVDNVILRPLPYRDAGQLYVIHEVVPKFSHLAPLIPVNARHYSEWTKSLHSFDQIAMTGGLSFNLTGTGDPERIPAARTSWNLFSMLGVEPQLGRTFVPEDDQPGHANVVVLTDELWRRRFGGDRDVVGRKIQLNGQPYEIIGVLPAAFHFPKLSELFAMTLSEERPQLWKPFGLRYEELDWMGDFNYNAIAHLRTGISAAQAGAELNAEQARITAQTAEKIELRAVMVPFREQITSRSRMGLDLMLAAVAAVLLIACVNIANLMLARAAKRRREIAIRTAIGAGRGRLVRQALVESLLLAAIGGALGLVLAFAATRVIVASAPVDVPRLEDVHPNARMLLFTSAITMLAGLFFGLFPAWHSARTDPAEAMQSGGRSGTPGRRSGHVRWLLVCFEVGLSAMCLIAGGLLLRSFVKLMSVDGGFRPDRVLTVDLALPGSRYSNTAKQAAFADALLARVAGLPGVTAAGIVNKLPLGGEGNNNLLQLEGTHLPVAERPLSDIRNVTPDYFRAIGIPLRAGRIFGDGDRARQVALVSAMTAEKLWPRQTALGKRFRIGGDNSPLMEVVGVVGDIHGVSLNKAPSMTVYVPFWQRSNSPLSVVVKTAIDPATISAAMRAAIRQVDPELPVPTFRTMQAIVEESVAQRRFQMNLVLLFAAAAILLAGLGIYGVVSYAVAQRTNEMGIRLALGARPEAIVRLVLGHGLMPVAVGLAAGAAVSIVLGRLLGALLYGVTPADPITIAAVAAVLGIVGVAACYLPARRATRVDPAIALRTESSVRP
jgi:predicted permease